MRIALSAMSSCGKRLGCNSRLVCEAAAARKSGTQSPLSACCVRPNDLLTSASAGSVHCPNNGRTSNMVPIPEDASQMISEMTTSYFRRPLPEHLISFTSTEGRAIFSEALAAGTLENYFDLVGNFTHQTEPAYCGLGSLAMVLNACEVDPGRTWKGVWRWYSDDMLECCAPLDVIKQRGITFDQFGCLATCHSLAVEEHRYEAGEEAFMQFLNACRRTATEPGVHLVASFSRASLRQSGDGHFSPIGGFHEEKQLVLVLDVARFKYPSYWVPVRDLWEAMEPVDAETGLSRGYHILRKVCSEVD